MKWPLLLLCLLSISTSHAKRGYLVGNGGEGIEFAGRLVLADLALHGLTERELLKQGQPSREMFNAVARLSGIRGFPAMKFAKKLDELEQRMPGLAGVILLGFAQYNWNFTPAAVEPVYTDNDIDWTGIEGKRHQLAVRYRNEIFFVRPAWLKLDDQNKIALLLHESVSGLLKLIPTKPGRDRGTRQRRAYLQSSRKLYRIVAAMMDPADTELDSLVRSGLRLSSLDKHWSRNHLQIELSGSPVREIDLSIPVAIENVSETLNAICRDVNWTGEKTVKASLPYPFTTLDFFTYPAIEDRKFGLKPRVTSAGQLFSGRIGSDSECKQAMQLLGFKLGLEF